MRRLFGGVTVKFKKRQTVRLIKDAPSGGPLAGSVGIVVNAQPGYPPLRGSPGKSTFYEVEFEDESGTMVVRCTVEEKYLEDIKGETAASRAALSREVASRPRQEEPSVVDDSIPTRVIGGRSSKFKRDDAVQLNTPLTSEGLPVGTAGSVTWVNLGPPTTYLVEFKDVGGATITTSRVDEAHLSSVD